MIRYAPSRGALPQTIHGHTATFTGRIVEAVKGRGTASVEEVIHSIALPYLRAAYQAGVREGVSQTTAELEAVVSGLVARAIDGIRIDAATCPHCNGGRTEYGPCEICEGTGKRHEPIEG